jgi:serine/threonine-protein kinase
MSPEQARGQEVDPRTDIWAFGCVLYECLTGKRAFGGETSVDVLTSVVDRDPDWEVLPAETPPGIRGLLGRCLRKNPRERLRHIVDARIWLEESSVSLPATGVALGEAAKSRQRRVRTVWIAVCGLTAVVGGLALWLLLSPRPAVSPTYWEVGVAPAESISDDLGDRPSRTAVALSPDGKSLVFVGRRGGTRQLYLGAPGRPEASPIAGTEQADSPFFSPDGRWIGFWAGPVGPGTRGELKKIALEGGLPVTLCGTCTARAGVRTIRSCSRPASKTPAARCSPGPSCSASLRPGARRKR